MAKRGLSGKMRLGLIVFVVLMALEIIEYFVGTGIHRGAVWPLAVLAAIAAWPIIWNFMHLKQLWRHEEE